MTTSTVVSPGAAQNQPDVADQGLRIFYFPYASLTGTQAPLLKAAALYFDKLILLDPEKASTRAIGAGAATADVRALDAEHILEAIAPEDVMREYETLIADAIREDLADPQFRQLCNERDPNGRWTLALAKVPKDKRGDPAFAPIDRSMQRMLGETVPALAPETNRYVEQPDTYTEVYDEYRESQFGGVEYRVADYPLAVGEAIMINHAIFGGLLYARSTPLTDDPFHSRILEHKLERVMRIPAVRDALEDRVWERKLKHEKFVATALQDVELGVIPADVPLTKILEYRLKYRDELAEARAKLARMAREIKASPWDKQFAEEVEHTAIPALEKALVPAKKSWVSWVKAAGILVGGVTAVVTFHVTPAAPLGAFLLGTTLAKDVALPSLELGLGGGDDKAKNGLHYLLRFKQA